MLRSSRESSLFILLHLLSFICINHSFYSLFIYTLQIYSISPISRILSIYLEAVEHQRPLFILFNIILHTAPEWCQPEMFATLSFSAVLFVCDQDKNLHVAQQILQGGNFCQLTSLLLHHFLSVIFTNSSWNHFFPTFSHVFDQM